MGWRDGHMDGWGTGGWIWMSVVMLLVWGGLLGTIVWAVRSFLAGPRVRGGSRADDILAERYARGEIDDEEFSRRRDQLHSGRT